jgi:hypothetical protein
MEQAAEPVSPVHTALICCDGGRTDVWNRRFQPEGSVGTVAVVVLDVDPKQLLEVSRPTISSQSRHSARTVRIQRSA